MSDEKQKNLRTRNLVTLLIIFAFAVLIYVIGIVKLKGL